MVGCQIFAQAQSAHAQSASEQVGPVLDPSPPLPPAFVEGGGGGGGGGG